MESNKLPKVSVIIPVYNAQGYLRECLDSIINQTLRDIEIICVDDGSTDASLSILREYQKCDDRVFVIAQAHYDAGTARNNGFAYASGKYVVFLDADDFFEPQMLEMAYKRALDQNAEIVVFQSDAYDSKTGLYKELSFTIRNKLLPKEIIFAGTDIKRDIFTAFAGWAWDKLFLREFIIDKDIRFQEQRTTNDLSFTYTALACAKRIIILEELFAHHRINVTSSLEKTRSQSYSCFYYALLALREGLITRDLFNRFEQDFINYSLYFCLENLYAVNGATRKELYGRLKSEWFKNLNITDHPVTYYYHLGEYLHYKLVLKISHNRAGKYAFGVAKGLKYAKYCSGGYKYSYIHNDAHRRNIREVKATLPEPQNVKANNSDDVMFTKKATYTGYNIDNLNSMLLSKTERANELKQVFYNHCHYYLNLDNPRTFNQKINWLKLYWYHEDLPRAVDKAEFKDYIKEKIGDGYTVPLYGVWEKESDIDFDKLPKKFVLKSTIQSDGKHIIRVENKETLDYDRLLTVLSSWLIPRNSLKCSYCGAYNKINPRILAEEYIEGFDDDLMDYKFFCFNGKVELLYVATGRFKNMSFNFYDLDWNLLPFTRVYPNSPHPLKKPQSFESMIEIASELSKPFPFVRVDFYETKEGKLYIGELTFYPGGGYETFDPVEWDYKLGDMLRLPKANV
ncbi:ATP-grasp fold amidoligase family protein [Butyrivibrio sp. TB]|uniref:ATP-grasp fold amidoligase family protein n=1 Tax=Butyrivibrio sp. TB TaxID=1520809 RepID=UPI0008CBCFE1|nr:ATP-grasp fold amidoligase family protein [Butyrivibrio sp. TB]SEP83323.1 Glycosyltransferase involved in cell wall bisynthesis [Butyrivibrio sp. TB]